jgi:hypothetical protein
LILPVLTELFNYILTYLTFPLVWKISSAVPIPKVHSPTEKSDYCPISILLVLAKAFENVMDEQMVNFVGRNGLFSSFQSGFRPGYSTATAIGRVSNDIRLNMESNQPTILVLLRVPWTVCAMDCSFLCATAFMQRQQLLSLLFFFSVSKSCMWGRCFSSSPISGWCSSKISYIATMFLSVY